MALMNDLIAVRINIFIISIFLKYFLFVLHRGHKSYKGKAKYLIGEILDPVLAVIKFRVHENFVATKKYITSELCNFTKFLLQQ